MRHHSSLFCQGERSYERENLQYDRSVSLARWSCSPLAPLEKRLPTGKNITSRVKTLIRESPSISHQSPRSGDQQRKDGGKQANDHGSGDRFVRLAPDSPRGSAGEQEDGGDRADQQNTEVHAEPAPTSRGIALAGWSAPVVRDETWDPPDVGEGMDSNQREPDQGTETVQGEEWASRARAGHHKSDPAADHHERRGDEQRGHHSQRQVGRASAYKGGRSGVVA